MKVTYRIPSKKVPYGYIEIDWERTDGDASLPSPEELAQEYAAYILAYQKAEVAAFEQPPKAAPKAKPDPVDAAADLMREALGATEVDGDDPAAPWNEDETPTTSKPADSNESDWDF